MLAGNLRPYIRMVLLCQAQKTPGMESPAIPEIQRLKGMLREFEEELVWAHFGVQVKHVHHLRLGFYTGDIFTEQPKIERDVGPVLDMLRKIKPTVISVARDPEGSGPDTHYKVMQVMAEAIRAWQKEEDLHDLRIIGYRNVWYQFHPAEADVIVPVSLPAIISVASYLFLNAMVTLSVVVFLFVPGNELASLSVMLLDDAGETAQAMAMSLLIIMVGLLARGLFYLLTRGIERRSQAWTQK